MVAGSGPNRLLAEELEGFRLTFVGKSLSATEAVDLRDNAALADSGCLAAVLNAELL